MIDTKKLTDIAQIFDPVSGRVPNVILMEGMEKIFVQNGQVTHL